MARTWHLFPHAQEVISKFSGLPSKTAKRTASLRFLPERITKFGRRTEKPSRSFPAFSRNAWMTHATRAATPKKQKAK